MASGRVAGIISEVLPEILVEDLAGEVVLHPQTDPQMVVRLAVVNILAESAPRRPGAVINAGVLGTMREFVVK